MLNANLHLILEELYELALLFGRLFGHVTIGLELSRWLGLFLSSVDVGAKVSNSVVSAEERNDVVAAWRRGWGDGGGLANHDVWS